MKLVERRVTKITQLCKLCGSGMLTLCKWKGICSYQKQPKTFLELIKKLFGQRN